MAINKEVKGTLAKLLATENLIIEHRKVSTASFDVLNRVLVLPIWECASEEVYNLLVGHEVGHALYTPCEDWRESVKYKISPDYVNVVEDARVEKLMKRRYGGLARTFYNGYKQLNDDDFFCIQDDDIEKMSLIDRINLKFKIGNFIKVSFTEEEETFISLIDKAESFRDVLDICEKIYEFLKDKNEEEITPPSGLSDLSEDVEIQSTGSSGNDPQEIESIQDEIFFDEEDQPQGDKDSQSTEKESNDSDADSENSHPATGGESGEAQDQSNQGGETANEIPEESQTQKAFDEKISKMVNLNSTQIEYIELPKVNLKDVIVDIEDIRHNNETHFQNICAGSDYVTSSYTANIEKYMEYKKSCTNEVNYLVKEFESKKSADSYARTNTARTGSLDTSKLHTYKYNEDLFKKVSVIPDGKNHGLIFILDWSGSMSEYLLDTVKQLMNLIWFCKKVQIPFEVYGFTYEWSNSFIGGVDKVPHVKKDRQICVHKNFYLLNFVSSRSKGKDIEQDMKYLWLNASCSDRKSHCCFSTSPGLGLSGTPLNESIIALHEIIPDFKNKHKLQKVNAVILTDGASNGAQYNVDVNRKFGKSFDTNHKLGYNRVSDACSLRDRSTGRIYRNFCENYYHDSVTTILLEDLKNKFPEVNLIGYRIGSKPEFARLNRHMLPDPNERWNYHTQNPEIKQNLSVLDKEKSFCFTNVGYDALFCLLPSGLDVQESKFDTSLEGTSLAKDFRKFMKSKRTNKKMLSVFASLVS
jgi:hypothetical protein